MSYPGDYIMGFWGALNVPITRRAERTRGEGPVVCVKIGREVCKPVLGAELKGAERSIVSI